MASKPQSPLKKFLWLYAAIMVAVLALVKVETVEHAVEAELRYARSTLGEDAARYCYEGAAGWYRTIALDWGLHEAMRNLFLPTDEQREKSRGLEEFGNYLFKYMSDRMEAFWRGLYLLFTRIWILMLWLPFIPIIVLPAFNHGWQLRNIKKTNFDYASPTLHTYTVEAVYWAVFIFLVLAISPFPANPLIYPALICIAGLMLSWSVANVQKRM